MIKVREVTWFLKLFFISFVLIFSKAGFAVSSLGAGKACLFSKMSGIICMDGKPVPNVTLNRKIKLSQIEEDSTTTDKDGRFSFTAVYSRSITKLLPQEFTVGQEITVTFEGKEYSIWSGVKNSPVENSESQGKPLVVTCELNSERRLVQVDGQPFFTLCSWDVELDEVDTGF